MSDTYFVVSFSLVSRKRQSDIARSLCFCVEQFKGNVYMKPYDSLNMSKFERWIKLKMEQQVETKLLRGLLDFIVLQFLSAQPMHGYQVITRFRRTFGVYFGPSTIYPLLNMLEKEGYLKSEWNMDMERPRKVYRLTTAGENLLRFTEGSLGLICRKTGLSMKVAA